MIRTAPKILICKSLWRESRSIPSSRDSWDENGLTALTVKQAELSLGAIVST
jgi:hypothetical protein